MCYFLFTRKESNDFRGFYAFETKAIHAGQEPDEATGATVVPIYQTSTFTHLELGKNRGYEYSRVANPTRTALETCLASLEGGTSCVCFASGQAASMAVLSVLSPGEKALVCEDLYGGTYGIFDAASCSERDNGGLC